MDPLFLTTVQGELEIRTKIGIPANTSTVITCKLSDPVKIESVGYSFGDNASIRPETVEPGKQFRVLLTATAKAKIKHHGRVIINLQGPSRYTFTLPVYIEVTE